MIVLIGTFVLVAGIILGAYWLFVLKPEQDATVAVKRRLKKGSATQKLAAALLKKNDDLGDTKPRKWAVVRMARMVAPIERTITQSGVKTNVATLLGGSAVCALAVFTVVWQVTGLILLAAVLGITAAFVPFWVVRFIRHRRMLKFEEQFPEGIDLLARALRAGHALTTGLAMVADELPEPVGPEFRLLFDQQNFGLPLPQALKNFADRIPTVDARFFVTAVLTQREAGGNLSEVLDNLSSIIRDRFKVKRQVRVISAHGRITGWILSALPTSLALFFVSVSPEKYRAFYTDPFGIKMIVVALVLQIIGVIIIRKIVQIEY